MATETLPSGNFVADIRRAAGRWRLSLGTDKPKEARRRKAMLSMLADTEEGRAILDRIKARELKVSEVVEALSPGGRGIGALAPKATSMSVAQASASYLAGVTKRAATRKQVEIVARQLTRAFGSTPVAKVTKAQAREWLHRKEWAPRTQEYKHVYARAIFAEAKVRENVWDEVRPHEIEEKHAAFLTYEETHAFLAQLPVKLRAWMACGYLGGMRSGEAANLRWQDVEYEKRVVHVKTRGGARKWTTKSGKSRVVNAPRALLDALRAWQREKDSRGEYVFGMRLGPLGGHAQREWTIQAYEIAGMTPGRADEGWTYHAGRHSAASNALRSGAPVSVVAKWIGDTVPTLLKTYSHVLDEDCAQVAESLDYP